MTREGMGACIAVEGATTKVVFEAYVEEALAPSLRPGQVMVMDNLSSHKGQRVRELIEGRGCKLLYLPPYSRPTSTPSSRPSPRSRGSCDVPRRAPEKRSSRLWARRLAPCPPEMPEGSSGTAATVRWVNSYDRRSSILRGGER